MKTKPKTTEQILMQILADIHLMKTPINTKADDDGFYYMGYQEAKRDIARIVKNYIINPK